LVRDPGRDSVPTGWPCWTTKGCPGYVAVASTGDTLRLTAVHRSAQNYRGELSWSGTAVLGAQVFACRTSPLEHSRVVQMASGQAESRLNDALFDPDTDTVLRLSGVDLRIRSAAQEDSKPFFEIEMKARPHIPEQASLEFQILPDYYRSRYIPYYQPLDRKRCLHPYRMDVLERLLRLSRGGGEPG